MLAKVSGPIFCFFPSSSFIHINIGKKKKKKGQDPFNKRPPLPIWCWWFFFFFFARPGLGCSVSSQEGKARIYLSVYKKAHVVTRFSGCRVTIQIKKERELGRLNRREKAIWKGSQLLTEEFHPVIQLFVPLSFERF